MPILVFILSLEGGISSKELLFIWNGECLTTDSACRGVFLLYMFLLKFNACMILGGFSVTQV